MKIVIFLVTLVLVSGVVDEVVENEAERECFPQCGGIMGTQCAERDVCVDDPSDNCDPENGADCGGLCVPPGKTVLATTSEDCNLMDIRCADDEEFWSNECGCGCKPGSTCPEEEPQTGDVCERVGETCPYGEEVCCGKSHTSYECTCFDNDDGNAYACLYTDACMGAQMEGFCDDDVVDPPPRDCEDPAVCIQIYDPVCGSDGRTYGNSCEFENARDCPPHDQIILNEELHIAYEGECRGDEHECPDDIQGGGECEHADQLCVLATTICCPYSLNATPIDSEIAQCFVDDTGAGTWSIMVADCIDCSTLCPGELPEDGSECNDGQADLSCVYEELTCCPRVPSLSTTHVLEQASCTDGAWVNTIADAPECESCIPEECDRWFDGCNMCTRSIDENGNVLFACTEMACDEDEMAYCKDCPETIPEPETSCRLDQVGAWCSYGAQECCGMEKPEVFASCHEHRNDDGSVSASYRVEEFDCMMMDCPDDGGDGHDDDRDDRPPPQPEYENPDVCPRFGPDVDCAPGTSRRFNCNEDDEDCLVANCDGVECEEGQGCIVDEVNCFTCPCPPIVSCVPIDECEFDCIAAVIPVCSFDGVEFNNECELHREECRTKTRIGFNDGPCRDMEDADGDGVEDHVVIENADAKKKLLEGEDDVAVDQGEYDDVAVDLEPEVHPLEGESCDEGGLVCSYGSCCDDRHPLTSCVCDDDGVFHCAVGEDADWGACAAVQCVHEDGEGDHNAGDGEDGGDGEGDPDNEDAANDEEAEIEEETNEETNEEESDDEESNEGNSEGDFEGEEFEFESCTIDDIKNDCDTELEACECPDIQTQAEECITDNDDLREKARCIQKLKSEVDAQVKRDFAQCVFDICEVDQILADDASMVSVTLILAGSLFMALFRLF